MTRDPGSLEALRYGCQCPVVENNFGYGYMRNDGTMGFIRDDNCPLHGTRQEWFNVPRRSSTG